MIVADQFEAKSAPDLSTTTAFVIPTGGRNLNFLSAEMLSSSGRQHDRTRTAVVVLGSENMIPVSVNSMGIGT